MKANLNLIRKYLSCCLNCGSLIVDDGRLCRSCKGCLAKLKAPRLIASSTPFNISTLYRWTPGQSDLLSRLVLSLKGSQSRSAWRYYAQDFIRHYLADLASYQQICVVPAPSRNKSKDHATLWAEEIAQIIGARVVPCLQKTKESQAAHQRGADRADRSLIEMEIVENNTKSVNLNLRTLWIFADDIVTTGATARAAHIALGRPVHFAVWALAQRGLSCGASRDLLYKPNA